MSERDAACLARRRDAALRMPPLADGRRDPIYPPALARPVAPRRRPQALPPEDLPPRYVAHKVRTAAAEGRPVPGWGLDALRALWRSEPALRPALEAVARATAATADRKTPGA